MTDDVLHLGRIGWKRHSQRRRSLKASPVLAVRNTYLRLIADVNTGQRLADRTELLGESVVVHKVGVACYRLNRDNAALIP